jgi:hypothetical protein
MHLSYLDEPYHKNIIDTRLGDKKYAAPRLWILEYSPSQISLPMFNAFWLIKCD